MLLSTLNGLENGALEHTSSGVVRILRPGGSRLILVAGRLLTAGRWPQGVWSLGACCPLDAGARPRLPALAQHGAAYLGAGMVRPTGGRRRVDAVRGLALGIFGSGMTRNATIAQIPLAPSKIDIANEIHRAKKASCQRHEAATEIGR